MKSGICSWVDTRWQ